MYIREPFGRKVDGKINSVEKMYKMRIHYLFYSLGNAHAYNEKPSAYLIPKF